MVRFKGLVLALFILFCGAPQLYAASEKNIDLQLKKIEERLNKIEGSDEQSAVSRMETEDRLDKIENILGDTKVGGWIDGVYSDNDKKGHEQFFDPHHFYLFVDNKFNESWRAFAELEFEHAPELDGEGELKLERGYIQYTFRECAKLRFGKFNTPLGIWTPEHWAINVDTIQKPIHEDNKYVPVKQVGMEYFGSIFPEAGGLSMEVNYAAYVSNGPEVAGTNNPDDNILGGGGDLNIRFNDVVLVGGSFYTQNNPDKPEISDEKAAWEEEFGRQEDSFMYYGEILLPIDITLRGEVFSQNRNGEHPDVAAYYAKVKWEFLPQWYINYRRAWGDDEKAFSSSSSGLGRNPARDDDPGPDHTIDTVTLAYWPINSVRMKLEYNWHHFEKDTIVTDEPDGDESFQFEEFNSWAFWIGYVF